jgi:hypothetical protein
MLRRSRTAARALSRAVVVALAGASGLALKLASGVALKLASGLALALASGVASAQAWPAKPIRMLVGFPPGGTSDILARTVANKLTPLVGQSVVVENRAGAAGNIAAEALARSAPDGYTVLMGTSSLAISQSLYAKLNYDLVRDLLPVTQAANYTNLLVVHPGLPVSNVAELLALAKAKPGTLSYGSAGNGTPPHLTGDSSRATPAPRSSTCRTRAGRRRSPISSAARSRCSSTTCRRSCRTYGAARCVRSPSRRSPAPRCCPTCRRCTSSG